MSDDVLAALSRRSTVRRALAFVAVSLVIVLTVAARALTEPTPRAALGAGSLARPLGPAGGTSPAATSGAAPSRSAAVAGQPSRPTRRTTAALSSPATRPTHQTPTHQTPTQRASTKHAPAPTTHRPVPTTTAPRTTAAPTTAPTTRVTGAAFDVGYGIVQVRVTFSGRRLVDVTAVSLPSGGRSSDISAMAAPVLRREALAAQGAGINAVSGASYTSAGYARSLQSALDRSGR